MLCILVIHSFLLVELNLKQTTKMSQSSLFSTVHFCTYLVCSVLYAKLILPKFQWRRVKLWLPFNSVAKNAQMVSLEEPASCNGNLSCWKHLVKLCNTNGRFIDQQDTACSRAPWYTGLWSKNLFLPPEQFYLSSHTSFNREC